MKQLREKTESGEPIGIVIADGGKPEAAPQFWAYVWGPAPEPTTTVVTDPKAA
jgi:hypothetical protein